MYRNNRYAYTYFNELIQHYEIDVRQDVENLLHTCMLVRTIIVLDRMVILPA